MKATARKRLPISASIIYACLFVAGTIQYVTAIGSSGETAYFDLDQEIRDNAGPLRYVKDAACVLFGLYWPFFAVRRGKSSLLTLYLIWLLSVCLAGIIPVALGYGPLVLVPAGLRWLLVVHAGFGLAFVAENTSETRLRQDRAILILTICAGIELLAILLQLSAVGLGSLDVLRLPGVFGNAGAAGYFALALGISAASLTLASFFRRFVLLFAALAIAALSGTRFAVIGITALAPVVLNEFLTSGVIKRLKMQWILLQFMIAVPAVLVVSSSIINSSGRGDLIGSQFGEGSRVSGVADFIERIASGDALEVALGQGLGVGTNAGIGLTSSAGIGADTIKWDVISDNTFVTTLGQIGLLGGFVFFAGCASFMIKRRRNNLLLIALLVLGFGVQNMPEQFFLMLAFAIGFTLRSRGGMQERVPVEDG